MKMSVRMRSALAVWLVAVMVAPLAWAERDDQDAMKLLEQFVHYAIVGNPDLAEAYARQLLDLPLEDADYVMLLEEGIISQERWERAMRQATRMAQLEDVAGELSRRVEQGHLDLARNVTRIENSIEMLIGTQRQRMLGQRRLVEAGEYAVPMLLNEITEGRDQRLRLAVQDVVRRIGRHAVVPLCEALPELGEATNQRIICDLLGDIGYPQAAPFLLEISRNEQVAGTVREAARRAFNRLNLTAQQREMSLSELYTWLSRQYFNEAEPLIAYPREDTNNVWSYDGTIGLTPTAVPTPIYSQVMSMRMSSRALEFAPDNAEAVMLFVAANLRRENQLPQGKSDPIFGDEPYSPDFYATVFGTRTCLDVLGLALDIENTPLVRDAIGALARTTGGANLFAYGDGRQPLLEAMYYPDRRVQYEAALVLGKALPEQSFGGDDTVVPLLASAVRMGDQLFALVVGDDGEDRRHLGSRLEDVGFDIVGSEASATALRDAIAHAVGVDLIVIQMRTFDRAEHVLRDLRQIAKTSVAPVLIVVDQRELPTAREAYRDEMRVDVARAGLPAERFAGAIDALMDRAAGGRMTEAEAEIYAFEALGTLRDIAISRSPVYDLTDAEIALLDAMEQREGAVRLLVADILAMMDSERAQRHLFDAALDAHEGEQIDLLERVAESVKRFGNRAQERHVNGLMDLLAEATGRRAEAAAQVYGALNLPPAMAIEFVPRR